MQVDKITKNIKDLYKAYSEKEFIYQFIESLAFYPKNTIKRLKNDRNLSQKTNELIWKDKIYFINSKEINSDIHLLADELKNDIIIKKHKIRFLIITNFDILLSIDTKTNHSLECKFLEIHKFVDFFLPLIGVEKFQTIEESPADIKAANNIGKLYDQILNDNKNFDLNKNRFSLNIFFTRLLFLYYSDDSNIFEKNLFLKTISDFTKKDGSDLDQFFIKLFNKLGQKTSTDNLEYLKKFPYVNGFLFKEKITIPKFSKKTREMIIDSASLDWQKINPDILGSMLQEVVSPDERGDEEMHYTSVPNILKVLDPLFLDELRQKVDEANLDENKLKKILKFIYSLKIFDPACGSGNFLIVAYKQICLIEIDIIKKLKELNPDEWKLIMPGVKISQFYGLEKSHFATETAKLSIWLAEHQMNFLYEDVFEKIKPSLPIEDNKNIICANSISYKWENFFKKDDPKSNIFILGNPPYKAYPKRTKEQQDDVKKFFGSNSKIDYVGLWFMKACNFADYYHKSKIGFVATNSINQGEQVELVWSEILRKNFNIFFAHKSFQWKNNARNNATVTVSIICLAKKNTDKNYLVLEDQKYEVKNINPYLISAPNIIIKKNRKSVFNLPKMTVGEMPRDDGNLLLNLDEKNKILDNDPLANKFIRPYMGGEEFINDNKRWCIWIKDEDKDEAYKIQSLKIRIDKVKIFRKKSKNISTQRFVEKPYRFVEVRKQDAESIFLPETSSSMREYVPVGFGEKETIFSNAIKVIYSSPLYMLGLLSSSMHNVWLKNIGGRLRNDIRYSTEIVYNNFPIIEFTEKNKKELNDLSYELIDCRNTFFDKNIAFLYNRKTMPNSLRIIHDKIDNCVDSIYSKKNFLNDNERLAHLFNLYAKKTLNMELF